MAKSKRAQGMPVNVIIIAAIALVVLFVLVALFTGKIRGLSQDLENCSTKQGRCARECEPNEAVASGKCSDAEEKEGKKKCCITVFKSDTKTDVTNPTDQKAGP